MFSPQSLLKRLESPIGRIRAVLDTDTYNEVDDQFALAYCLLAPERIKLEAVHSAPFHNDRSNGPEDGMLRSCEEIHRVISRIQAEPENFVFEGARQWLKDSRQPIATPATDNLIRLAMAAPEDDPLYVIAIAAPTNVASAILLRPEIINHIVVVWLGGQPHYWHMAHEFNLYQDIAASKVLFDSGVPLIQVPCTHVAEHLMASLPFLDAYLKGRSALGDYLTDIVHHYTDSPFCWSKPIWDISTVAWLVNPGWFETKLTATPILNDDFSYSFDETRQMMRVALHLDRDAIFKDLFTRINALN